MDRKPLALTMGDPAGIGPEITALAWQQLKNEGDESAFFVVGDPALYEGCPTAEIESPHQANALFSRALPVLPTRCARPAIAGQGDSANGRAVLTSIERTVDWVQLGEARAVVTNPINKAVLYDAGFEHPGHTEFLQTLARTKTPTVMMLADGDFRVVPITLHVSLEEAIHSIRTQPELIEHAVRVTQQYLQSSWNITRPRLVVSGLNPHAGEQGAMGREEIEVITPILDRLRAEGFDLRGPLPADTLFHRRARQGYDAALCMTHDQALIPIKTIGFDTGVNCTMGLPFVRTSPDHGTAFDIAGKYIARPDSLIAAIRLAARLSHR